MVAPEIQSLGLLILIIAAFVIAFKILEMVFETIMVSVLSGLFYVVLSYVFNYPLSLNQVLTFSFLGAVLYMAYTIVASIYGIAMPILALPFKLLGSGERKGRNRRVKKRLKNVERKLDKFSKKVERSTAAKPEPEPEEPEPDVKEVVLNKVKEKNEEEDDQFQ